MSVSSHFVWASNQCAYLIDQRAEFISWGWSILIWRNREKERCFSRRRRGARGQRKQLHGCLYRGECKCHISLAISFHDLSSCCGNSRIKAPTVKSPDSVDVNVTALETGSACESLRIKRSNRVIGEDKAGMSRGGTSPVSQDFCQDHSVSIQSMDWSPLFGPRDWRQHDILGYNRSKGC
ncbi:hypothetical protein AG1IA_00011 [Rhizoctonia solani AG-1 IA]|uniref:Uncharacterized protein n=1 Tax=Thanatephorus cucumeris (strain AG1-IA) TaxID=983506 RepID=L8X6L4_THACA|nr:hypothetical protein AG1IA_00011 [Rhizoctonia solani AG-1 IA]